jgi:hypothetical protein
LINLIFKKRRRTAMKKYLGKITPWRPAQASCCDVTLDVKGNDNMKCPAARPHGKSAAFHYCWTGHAIIVPDIKWRARPIEQLGERTKPSASFQKNHTKKKNYPFPVIAFACLIRNEYSCLGFLTILAHHREQIFLE